LGTPSKNRAPKADASGNSSWGGERPSQVDPGISTMHMLIPKNLQSLETAEKVSFIFTKRSVLKMWQKLCHI
jgi:hypothetical protein